MANQCHAAATRAVTFAGYEARRQRSLEHRSDAGVRQEVIRGNVNAVIPHGLPHWRRALAGQGVAVMLKVSALLSLLVWVAAVVAGRWIGFL